MEHRRTKFVGSWRLTLSPILGTTPHRALVTFAADGTLIASPPSVEEFPLLPGGIVHVSTGHGEWNAISEEAVVLAFEAQATDAQGTLVGMGSVRCRLDLSPGGQTFTGSYAFAMTNPDGIVFATEEGAIGGARIAAAPPEASSIVSQAAA